MVWRVSVCMCVFVHLFPCGWQEVGVHDCWWMDEINGEKKRERDDEGGKGRVNRALCGAWYGCVTPGLGSSQLCSSDSSVCSLFGFRSSAQEQLNNRWQERGSIHRAGHTETYTNTHKVMYAEICAWMPACFLSGLNEDTYTKAGVSEMTFSKQTNRWVVWTRVFELGSRNAQVTAKSC